MTFQRTSLLGRRARWSRLLCLGLLVAGGERASALSVPQRVFGSQGRIPGHASVCAPDQAYLTRIGVSPLRYEPPPPDPVERPAPPEVKPVAVAPTPDPTPPTVTPGPVEPPKPVASTEPKQPPPVSIIPDDTPHQVKPEDVLPYFQLPSQNDSSAAVNVPFTPARPANVQPPSSATYQLK